MRQKFLVYLECEKRCSHHTTKAYRSDLDQIEKYLVETYSCYGIEHASFDMIRSWMVSLIEQHISARSVARKISSVRAFFKWAKKFHAVHNDPTAKLTLPKVPSRLPVYIEEDVMESIPSDFFADSFIGLRNRAIIEMFYQTGIRTSELIGLKISYVDSDAHTIKIKGKRNKERIIPITAPLSNLLHTYTLERAKQTLAYHENFFLTEKGEILYPKLVYKLVNSYLSQTSSLKKKSPHVLRHTFATHMLNRGADLNAIKELLGHTSLASTQIYTHNSIDVLKTVHRDSHPKG